tara:strand:+ start:126 stop:548 length:423 start_codon:yes stop_codon:yes gene_type:complete
MSFRKSAFDIVGHFNTELGRIGSELGGGEEKDIFKRIYNRQMKVLYVPDAIVFHTVPEERTTYRFIKQQAIGTGKSEYIRIKNQGKFKIFQKILIETFKWYVSFILFIWYTLTLRIQKGWMIIRFRFWVSFGILNKLINR